MISKTGHDEVETVVLAELKCWVSQNECLTISVCGVGTGSHVRAVAQVDLKSLVELTGETVIEDYAQVASDIVSILQVNEDQENSFRVIISSEDINALHQSRRLTSLDEIAKEINSDTELNELTPQHALDILTGTFIIMIIYIVR